MIDASTGTYILIVDDEPALREALAAVIGDLGWSVRTCGDGAEALAMVLAFGRPALALIDVMLPDTMGDALAERLLGAPVALMSGYPIDQVRRSPAVRYLLAKPFGLESLQVVLDRLAPRTGCSA